MSVRQYYYKKNSLFTRESRLDMASWVFSCAQFPCHQALKDASGKHKTFAYLTKINCGPSGSKTVVVKMYYLIQKWKRNVPQRIRGNPGWMGPKSCWNHRFCLRKQRNSEARKFSNMPLNIQRLLLQFRVIPSHDVKANNSKRCYTTPHCYLSGITKWFVHFERIFMTPIPEVLPIHIPQKKKTEFIRRCLLLTMFKLPQPTMISLPS
jgi:hypothetical protein